MTLNTNARVAGVTYLVYLAAGIGSMAFRGKPGLVYLTIATSFCALILGVTLHAITRDEDRDIALLAFGCRLIEAVPGEGMIYFAVGQTLFAWLLFRGRIVPQPLAFFGMLSSGLLIPLIPSTSLLGWSSALTWALWTPCLIFEIALAIWFLTKGVRPAARTQPA